MSAELIARLRKMHAGVVDEGEVRLKSAKVKSPNVDVEQRLVSGLVSVAVRDLDDEVVIPSGMDMSYFPTQVKAVYWAHNYDQPPVGKCRVLSLRDGGDSLYAQTYIAKGAFGDDVLTAMAEGIVEGFSVGFRVEEMGPPTPEEIKRYGECAAVVRKSKLIEYSITPMPACPAALVEMVSKGKIHRSSAALMGMTEKPGPRRAVVVGGAVYVR